MEHQEIESERSDEEHLSVGRSSGSRRVCSSLNASRGSDVSTTPLNAPECLVIHVHLREEGVRLGKHLAMLELSER